MSHREHVQEYSRPEIDGFVVRGVKIIGTESRGTNGKIRRIYPQAMLRRCMGIYESAPVFIDHRDDKEARDGTRKTWDHFGHLQNIRERGEVGGYFGLYGDLAVKPSHPMAREILAAAANNPKFGLSHDANCELSDDGKEVLDILELYSVDLVDKPATNKNLFESSTMSEETEIAPAAVGALIKSMDAYFAALEKRLDAMDKALTPGEIQVLTESSGKPPAKKEKLYETIDPDDEGEPAKIGNTHDDFMGVIHGFPLTNP